MSQEDAVPVASNQIRIIIDRGKSILCPLCHVTLDAGLGHLCRGSADGITSGQTWRLSGGQEILTWKDGMHQGPQPHGGVDEP